MLRIVRCSNCGPIAFCTDCAWLNANLEIDERMNARLTTEPLPRLEEVFDELDFDSPQEKRDFFDWLRAMVVPPQPPVGLIDVVLDEVDNPHARFVSGD
jgi:hypothetical protein